MTPRHPGPDTHAGAPAWVRAPGAPLARSLLLPTLLFAGALLLAATLRPAPASTPAEIRAALRAGHGDPVDLPEVSSASPDVARQQAILRGVALELRALPYAPPSQRPLRRARALHRLEDMSDAR